jgi:4-hydroxy-tetrahydrodipicolinate synthase
VITFVAGDLTEQHVDAIVNAANEALAPGGGVCGAIRRAGGDEIFEECARLGGCATGDAKATDAGRLPARYVIHAVGPVWQGGGNGEAELLASAHRRSLEVAEKLACRTVALPALSTGVYGYPPDQAAPVAVAAVAKLADRFEEVRSSSSTRRCKRCTRSILETMLGEVLTAIVTPFREDGSVDFHRFATLAHYLVEHGSDGVVVAGTTGESPTLSEDERLELFRVAVGAVGEQATVIAGTGTYSTAESVHFTEQAHEIGVDGFLVVTPYYSKPPQRGIVEHFEAIASVSDRPVIVYNIPGRVVVNIEPETMARLAEIENVRAVKQANDDLHQARFIVEQTGLDLYAGDDNIVFPFLEVGGMGGVCVHTHVVGPRVKEMIRLHKAGDHVEARRIDEELEAAYDLLKVETNPIAIKAALNLLGHEVGGLRLPLVEATEEQLAQVRSCLDRLGLLVAA